jgi:ABC-type nitrate/sulfonate/bicarbonate transport system substrate-binding protein
MNNEAATSHQMTETEATDQAVLLFVRKVRRLHPEAFADVIARLPEGARWALTLTENRADILRDQKGIKNLEWPELEEITED